jgi:hypothetical protein
MCYLRSLEIQTGIVISERSSEDDLWPDNTILSICLFEHNGHVASFENLVIFMQTPLANPWRETLGDST